MEAVDSARDGTSRSQRRVGILYDERMCRHHTPDDEPHPENPNRIKAIWNKLQTSGITERCDVLSAKEAEDKYILSVHGKIHVNLIRNISSKQFNSRRNRIASKLNSIYLNEGSSEAAYLAAGSVIEGIHHGEIYLLGRSFTWVIHTEFFDRRLTGISESQAIFSCKSISSLSNLLHDDKHSRLLHPSATVAKRVAKGELDSAFAIVRPPGHHAEHDEAMGFCLYNNVAIATNFILNKKELGINKILIVDWDVHHGNGTQKTFWKDPRVLFFSVHRHEFGSFYPSNDDGDYKMIGEGPGAGYNINVPWENGRCGDADYLAVWDHILIPVAKQFNPDMILISAGFDAAVGDPLGGCRVTPYGYAMMLTKLMDFARGKIVLALEGGYNLTSISNSALACMEVLLDGKTVTGSTEAYPFESTWRVIQAVRQELKAFWSVLADELPTKLISQKAPIPVKKILTASSDSEAEDVEELLQDVIQPLSTLRVDEDHRVLAESASVSWRSDLSKIDVWYATFGSNMWKPRFLCYIEGGQVDGMQRPCSGSMDKRPPKEILWKIFPRRLFFGRESTHTWGVGGVAFLHPESKNEDIMYMCLYRITLEQFNDVVHQENISSHDMTSPLFDLTSLDSIKEKGSINLDACKKGWYHSVVHLGMEQDIPILTMTCDLSDIENFKSGKIPLCVPSKDYADTLVKGLVEGGQLSKEEAVSYIEEAASKPL